MSLQTQLQALITAIGADIKALYSVGPGSGSKFSTGTRKGTVTIDFGAFPGSNKAMISVTGLTDLAAGDTIVLMASPDTGTTDHGVNDNLYFGRFVSLVPTGLVAGVGFTVTAISEHYMQGQWVIQYSY